MLEKEVIAQGEAFERLFNNADFKVLQEFVQSQIQGTSGPVLTPSGPNPLIKSFEDYKHQTGVILGLAMPQSHMENIIEQMKKFKEERRLKEKQLEEEKRARTK